MEKNSYSDDGTPTGRVSKFNSMQAILFRIDELWRDAHKHSRQGLYEKWNIDLDRIFCELVADAKPEDDTKFKEFNKKISEIGFVRNKETRQLVQIQKLYMKIMEKEIFLRKLQNRQGKGGVYEESVTDYMD